MRCIHFDYRNDPEDAQVLCHIMVCVLIVITCHALTLCVHVHTHMRARTRSQHAHAHTCTHTIWLTTYYKDIVLLPKYTHDLYSRHLYFDACICTLVDRSQTWQVWSLLKPKRLCKWSLYKDCICDQILPFGHKQTFEKINLKSLN